MSHQPSKSDEDTVNAFIEKFFIKRASDGTVVPPENCYDKEELQRQTDMVFYLKEAIQVKNAQIQKAVEEVTNDAKELYEALQMMWDQYCPEPLTHLYMTAGENCEEMLARHRKYALTPDTNQTPDSFDRISNQ